MQYSKCSNAMSWLGIALFIRVNSFVESLINMECELKITSWFNFFFCKNSMVIRHSVKELLAKNSVSHEIHSSLILV